ncbi:unnamed protein product [Leptosia nina]|uniref:Uncharacterized protein n=1 Tax=Leptosia nina TaxID=320188 RepID=A0AAV1JP36_9NEOP
MSKVNKENFRLLDLSSDEESEDLHLEIIPNRKRKISRKDRNRAIQPRVVESNFGTEVQCVLCWATRGTLVLWLLMLTWICASLYDQVTTMKVDIAKVTVWDYACADSSVTSRNYATLVPGASLRKALCFTIHRWQSVRACD